MDSFATISNLSYLESLYESFLQNPNQVDPSWRHFFEGMQLGSQMVAGSSALKESPDLRVHLLIEAYRMYGHLMARFNPIDTRLPAVPEELDLEKLNFKKQDLEVAFPTCGFLKQPLAPLKTLIEALEKTYAHTIGVEYMGLGSPELEAWVQERIEPYFPLHLSASDRVWIFELLNKAEVFETFLHTKYVGQKRFSLEGGETLIPMLTSLIEKGAELGVQEVTLGMAHRGRLNVLANILNKSYSQIFQEFEAHYTPEDFEGTGDVKYHKGFTGKLTARSGQQIAITLVANPSHLEAVNPVVEGIVRAKQEICRNKPECNNETLAVLIHGDASIAGQGVIYETMQLCRLHGYSTGGTIHIVVNNQIGFTTLPKDGRSTRYCTDIARSFGAVVFHVNAEYPEECVRVALLAIEIRQTFHCDVFIDLNCYRKYGHNESDEPTFTQPLEYALIKNKQTIRDIYKRRLVEAGVLDEKGAEQLEQVFKASLHEALETPLSKKASSEKEPPVRKESSVSSIDTKVPAQKLIALTERFCTVPPEMKIHPKVAHGVQHRLDMVHAPIHEPHIDWGMAEHLAYASLLIEGVSVRISGQDVRRGTFSHRHAMWVDQVKEWRYYPLSHLDKKQGLFDIFNSPLSEYAALGFEFGFSTAYPQALVIWEAQFGDFANGAQIIIDQFIASAEQKWQQTSSLVLFLPHGYEGQGPEHSSARIERFLQLTGHENMRVVNCSTPVQLFHLLRAQALLTIKKPLILFTPKSMLRHPLCLSPLKDFAFGAFFEVIDDPQAATDAKKICFCSGKIYYDLIAAREKSKKKDLVFIRVEQLFPFPKEALSALLQRYVKAEKFYWVQEEPSNMGAWEYIKPLMESLMNSLSLIKPLEYIGRERSASPAAGSFALHQRQTEEIVKLDF